MYLFSCIAFSRAGEPAFFQAALAPDFFPKSGSPALAFSIMLDHGKVLFLHFFSSTYWSTL